MNPVATISRPPAMPLPAPMRVGTGVGAAPEGNAKAIYAQRTENTYHTQDTALATELEATIAQHLPRDPHYTSPQLLDTVFVRSADSEGPKGKFRIRSYPESSGTPTFLEFKRKQTVDGHELTLKDRIPVAPDFVSRVLKGESAASILNTGPRAAADQKLADKAAHLVDDPAIALRPVVHETYRRAAFESPDGSLRMTIDRNLTYEGIGQLTGHGTTPGAVMDVKLEGTPPAWVTDLLDAHKGALRLATQGKGSTEIHALQGATSAA